MALFQIDYLKKTGALMKEAFTFKKYKAMHPALATFVGIFMSPFLIIGLLLTAILAVFAFVCNLLLTPLKHIHSLFQNEAKGVKHATQFIIYAISWPVFFLLYFAISLLFMLVYLLYAFISIFMYIFTLGGFKYHISPNADSDDIAINVKGRYLALPIVTICISAVLFVAFVIFGIMAVVAFLGFLAEEDEEIYMALFNNTIVYGVIAGACAGVSLLINMLMSLIGYAPRYVVKGDEAECCCCEEAAAEVVEEIAEVEDIAVEEEAPVVEEV